MRWHKHYKLVTVGLALSLAAGVVQPAKISDVRGTKHNLSISGTGSFKAVSESQVCVFCHTPHNAESSAATPLWNRKLSGATYTPYLSSSIEANVAELTAGPGGSSKLCLSCHDGTMAIDTVNVLNGAADATIAMASGGSVVSPAYMPPGKGSGTGYTRNLGVNLSNDHPISFTYNDALAVNDGELRPVSANPVVGNREVGITPKPLMPLENNQIQCATCHDPHVRDTLDENAKFLRLNRLQVAQPGTSFNQSTDIQCLACHEKGGFSWAFSSHANSQVATQTYTAVAANEREIPLGTQVWQFSCLNCHDAHTVQGAKRLLREGTDSATLPKSGGNPASEETCYTCHTNSASSAVNYTPGSANAVADIESDFNLLRHMPIKSSEQAAGTEVHDIGGNFNDGSLANCANSPTPVGQCGKDLLESRSKMGAPYLNNRHAECTDCHNPHRVVNFMDFRGNPAGNISGNPDGTSTHRHTDGLMLHTNIASGALRGTTGVEPVYGSSSFHSLPARYDVKRGDPGTSTDTSAGASHVTREYQICLKCHSNYGYPDNNVYPSGIRPPLGPPGTPSGTNGLTQYTNQAKEFQAPLAHKGAPLTGGASAGAHPAFDSDNYRSWHPVMDTTGRTHAQRGTTQASFLPPWKGVGIQTMYCSDCHGSDTGPTTVIPTAGKPWGPHGSNNDFLLKGAWNNSDSSLCFKCHDQATYASSTGNGGTGFSGPAGVRCNGTNLHACHTGILGRMKCNWCHTAVPHGWKNKALLVNLLDVGPEAGLAIGSAVNAPYNQGPYYMNAMLSLSSFARSGQWDAGNCGGTVWMAQNCQNPP